MNILLVEDHELNVDMLKRRLERRGCTVDVARDGAAALAKAATGEFNLILMDIGLPDMSGLEVTAQLRAREITRRIPIVALTAHALVGDRERALAAGCDDHAAKPVDLNALINTMARLMRREKRA